MSKQISQIGASDNPVGCQNINLLPPSTGWGLEVRRGPRLSCRPPGASQGHREPGGIDRDK